MDDQQAALIAAAITAIPGAPPGDVTALAGAYLAWLGSPLAGAVLRTGPTYRQSSAAPPRPTTHTPGGAVQLHDDEQVPVSLVPKDAKGYVVTGDQVTFTPADPAVITCQPDGLTCLMVAGAPGSTTVAITDGTISYTWAVDVVPGDVATFQVTEGAVAKQPAAAPPPASPAAAPGEPPAAGQQQAGAPLGSATAAQGQPGDSPGDDQSQDVAEHAGMTVSPPEQRT